jgi:hypothetical protein
LLVESLGGTIDLEITGDSLMAENVFGLLEEPLRRQIQRYGIAEASEIQKLAIPDILKGKTFFLSLPLEQAKLWQLFFQYSISICRIKSQRSSKE